LIALAARPGLGQARPSNQASQPLATNTQKLAPLDGNPALFAVLAAINAAGYDTEIDSPSNNSLRRQVRDYLSKQNIPSLPELRRFVRDHHLQDPTADLSQYISFALLSSGAPDFRPVLAEFQPPDVKGLQDLAPLLAAFYREADIPRLWQAAQPFYDAALEQYGVAAAEALQSVNVYLRNPINQQTKGRFQVFVDLLGAPNQAHARTYLDEYFVVVTPSAEPFIDEIRHHYLRFWADSLAFKYPAEIDRLRTLGDYALASPLLGEAYRQDFRLLATESFIRAVEADLDKNPAAVDLAKREGFVLAPAFADLLPAYEKQTDKLRDYFGDMLKQINIRKESVRLDHIDFATQRTVKTIQVMVPVKPPELTGMAKVLEDAETAFRNKKYDAARDAWTGVLAADPDGTARARAFYGLGRIALTERAPERADQLFRQVLDFNPDASTRAWTLVYLGKLADSQGEQEPARGFYRKALAVEGLPEQVKREAEQGLAGAFYRPPAPGSEADSEEDEDEEI
jgi:tetratricopeptide (TPR) repeat protein